MNVAEERKVVEATERLISSYRAAGKDLDALALLMLAGQVTRLLDYIESQESSR